MTLAVDCASASCFENAGGKCAAGYTDASQKAAARKFALLTLRVIGFIRGRHEIPSFERDLVEFSKTWGGWGRKEPGFLITTLEPHEKAGRKPASRIRSCPPSGYATHVGPRWDLLDLMAPGMAELVLDLQEYPVCVFALRFFQSDCGREGQPASMPQIFHRSTNTISSKPLGRGDRRGMRHRRRLRAGSGLVQHRRGRGEGSTGPVQPQASRGR